MKLIYQGDLHLRSTTPANRKDDYAKAQLSKLDQLLAFAEDHEATLLIGGDLTDVPSVGFSMYNAIQDRLKSYGEPVYTCTGNHDLYFHNQKSLSDTALYGLEGAGCLQVLNGSFNLGDDVVVHGVGWEQPVPEPVEGKFNVLLAHISVFESVPFYWKGEGYTPETLRNKYPGFQLYLCGDIHSALVDDNVIVSGSMMRQGIDQVGFKPRCYLIDTETMEITPLFYKIEEDVFTAPQEEVETTMNLDHLLDAMKEFGAVKQSYARNCLTLAKENTEVKNILEGIFDEIGNR